MEDWRRHLEAEPAERAEQRRRHNATPGIDGRSSGGGRMARGWRLVDDSWGYLRRRPRLMVLPALSAIAVSVGALVLFVPVLYLTRDLSAKVSFFIARAVCAAPFTFISTYFNVGFLAMVIADERGEQPRVRDGVRAAWRRLPAILAWTLLATIVGQAIAALERLPGGEWLGRLVGSLGQLAWGLATFFVVPILALEGPGAREAVRRSARAFRDRWGEAVTGDVTIGVVFGVLTIPGFVVGFVGADRLDHRAYAAGIVLLAVAVVAVVPLLVISSALTELFMLALYRYTINESATGPFSVAQLQQSLEPPKKSWWRR